MSPLDARNQGPQPQNAVGTPNPLTMLFLAHFHKPKKLMFREFRRTNFTAPGTKESLAAVNQILLQTLPLRKADAICLQTNRTYKIRTFYRKPSKWGHHLIIKEMKLDATNPKPGRKRPLPTLQQRIPTIAMMNRFHHSFRAQGRWHQNRCIPDLVRKSHVCYRYEANAVLS